MQSYTNPIPTLDDFKTQNIAINSYTDFSDMYFAFIDVLGFKNNYVLQVEEYKELFSFYFDLMANTNFMKHNADNSYVGQTSDSLYFYTNRLDYLTEFILLFSFFNIYAMSKNIFFRGGISKGKLSYKEKHQFFGNSVIGAYSIESSISQVPRIVIDNATYQDIVHEDNFNKILKSENERFYIEPFAYFILKDHIDSILTMYGIEFSNLKLDKMQIYKNILKQKKEFEYDNKNYYKYTYLQNKFEKSGVI